jgi:indolepyruvate ferredoxin oxidoreductase, alpha subunit
METNRILLMGNEAIARGALEGGVAYCTGYPGNPSSEILAALIPLQKQYGYKAEWSVNEIVALEAAAAFAFAGMRALVTMKQNGMNVCSDFLTTVCLNELSGALVVVVCDDPGPLTSSNEQDSRHFAKIAQIPLLEPSTPAEAKEMTKWLLNFSEEMRIPCVLRSVSRLSHGRGGVTLQPIPQTHGNPHFDTQKPLVGLPFLVTMNHQKLLQKMNTIADIFNGSPFNSYHGHEKAGFVIMATGLGFLQAREALVAQGLEEKVGILKIGTTWPLPSGLIKAHLEHADEVLFAEEIDPFLEDQVKILYSENNRLLGQIKFYGKNSGDICGFHGSGVGEMNTDILLEALSRRFETKKSLAAAYPEKVREDLAKLLVPRELSFCHGCPHRASFFAIKAALALDGRNGFVVGDIGCYGLAAGSTGYNQIKALHCMGSGMGNVCGFSKLEEFGFDQPTIAVVGDSTFYHAGIPALVNAKFNKANGLFVVLDNSITAMTGFQPNPASDADGSGQEQVPIPIENMVKGMGLDVTVLDPVANITDAIEIIYRNLQQKGIRVIVFRRVCSTFEAKTLQDDRVHVAVVEPQKCRGETCGCNLFCVQTLGCPGLQYDARSGKAYVLDSACNGCGLCVQLCSQAAISITTRT